LGTSLVCANASGLLTVADFRGLNIGMKFIAFLAFLSKGRLVDGNPNGISSVTKKYLDFQMLVLGGRPSRNF